MNEVPQKVMTPERLIRFWKMMLGNKGMFNISTVTMIEHTIKRLEELATTNKENDGRTNT